MAGGRERSGIRRAAWGAWPSLAAIAVIAVVLLRAAFDSGGYFPAAFTQAGAIAFIALGALALAHVPRHRIATHALIGIGALAGLAAWTGLSSGWSATQDTAVLDMQRGMLYVALFGLGLVAAGSGRFSRHLVWTVLAVITVIVGAGLISRLYPDVISATPTELSQYRLSYPLGYWNAFGALAAAGAILALGLAADPRVPVVLRTPACGVSVILGVAMYFSLSRGAWLALIVGAVVLVALGSLRGSLLLTAVIVGVAATIAVVRLQAYPGLIDDPRAGAGQLTEGGAYGPQLVVIVLLAMATQAVIAATRSSAVLMEALGRIGRPLAIGAGIVLAAVVAGAYGLRAADVEGVTARALDDSENWVSRQWDDFLDPAALSETGTARLTTAKGTRSDLYRVAIDAFETHPLRGGGAGSFEVRWIRTRDVDEKVRDAHSLELETLGELGLVGALLLLGFLAAVVVAALRARFRPGALTSSQAAAVGAACAVWIIHSFVDWDWEMPGLTGPMVVLAASLFPAGRKRRRRRRTAQIMGMR
ncbi:MAG: hypothetical protein H0T43_03100 [Solirubrobacterales bacterium]|nr:hypothetical protein [Solirubrobacterales bacterium]